MALILWTTLFSLCSLSHGDDDLACDKVMTSEHGALEARRGGDQVTSDICLGELRLHDPVTGKVFCLDREGGEEFLECGEDSTSTTTSTMTTTTPKSTTITTKTTTMTITTTTTITTTEGRKEECVDPGCCGATVGNTNTNTDEWFCETNSSEMPEKVVISSTGVAGTWQPGGARWLGQYELVRDRNKIATTDAYYIQSQSGNDVQPSYLYPNGDCSWKVSMRPNEINDFFYMKYQHTYPCRTVPTGKGGWYIYHHGINTIVRDLTMMVNSGPYPNLGAENGFNVSASGEAARRFAQALGVFVSTNLWSWGRPVFKNDKGRKLWHGTYGWEIGQKEGSGELIGLGSHVSPEDQTNWKYLKGTNQDPWESRWVDANVTVVKR